GIGQQLPVHVAESEHGADGQTVLLAGQRREGVEGAEDESGAVDEEEVITFFHGLWNSLQHFASPRKLDGKPRHHRLPQAHR
ncbi:hypothetical protein, partial [Tritonibacter sp. SIMBA_163]|uniref:hypothetical protein n=1 Tax=Tritonibacter sp. SIMBA_163 TaxID=3080868 RepID=UPI0039806DC4